MFKGNNRYFAPLGVTALLLATGLTSCLKADKLFPDEPEISNLRAEVVKVEGQDNEYTLTLTLDFQDGDGDLGNSPQPGSENFEVVDIRPGVQYPIVRGCFRDDTLRAGDLLRLCGPGNAYLGDSIAVEDTVFALGTGPNVAELLESGTFLYTFPDLSNDQRIPSISGTIVYTEILVTRLPEVVPGQPTPPPPPTQEVTYTVRIRDRAGNWSNTLTSNTVLLD